MPRTGGKKLMARDPRRIEESDEEDGDGPARAKERSVLRSFGSR